LRRRWMPSRQASFAKDPFRQRSALRSRPPQCWMILAMENILAIPWLGVMSCK
jgi:hypothetical protein